MKTLATIYTLCLTVIVTAQIDEAIKFKISCPNGNADETIIRLKDDATSAFDPQWDAWKIFTWNNMVPSIYSQTNDSSDLAINSIPTMTKDTVVNLYIRANITSGIYTLTTEQLGAFSTGIKISLKDLETNELYELNQDISHSFFVNADPLNDQMRFEVFYSTPPLATVSQDTVLVENHGSSTWTFELQDETNAILQTGSATTEQHQLTGLNNGTYTLLITDNYQLTDTVYFTIFVEDEPGDTTNYTQSDKVDEISNSTAHLDVETEQKVLIQSNNGAINIQLKNIEGIVEVYVYNLNGQIVHQTLLQTSNEEIVLNNQLRGQLLFVNILAQNFSSTKKIVL